MPVNSLNGKSFLTTRNVESDLRGRNVNPSVPLGRCGTESCGRTCWQMDCQGNNRNAARMEQITGSVLNDPCLLITLKIMFIIFKGLVIDKVSTKNYCFCPVRVAGSISFFIWSSVKSFFSLIS